MPARRDLDELERRGLVRRTHGGAVLPTTSGHEDSFARRLKVASEAEERLPPAAAGARGGRAAGGGRERLAGAAVPRRARRETVSLDSSSTSYFVARRIVET